MMQKTTPSYSLISFLFIEYIPTFVYDTYYTQRIFTSLPFISPSTFLFFSLVPYRPTNPIPSTHIFHSHPVLFTSRFLASHSTCFKTALCVHNTHIPQVTTRQTQTTRLHIITLIILHYSPRLHLDKYSNILSNTISTFVSSLTT